MKFVLGILNLRCLWATREKCLLGRWIDEARKRDLDYRDVSVGHVSPHLTSRLWYQPQSKDLVEHAVEKTKIVRDAEKPVKEGDPELEREWWCGC